VSPQGSLLIVDRHKSTRDALARRFKKRGYDVSVAPTGGDALALAASLTPDLVLLDHSITDIPASEVLTQLRRTRTRIEMPVILVTTDSRGSEVVDAFRLGANDYVTKPIDFPIALARIHTHLSHKRSVEALRESEERYALAVQGANDGVWDWNLVTDRVYWSPRWKAMLGYADDEIAATPEEWFSRVHDEDLTRVRSALTAHLDELTGHCESEHRILHRDGSYRWVLCRGAAIRDQNGKPTRLAGSLTDITDAKVGDPLTGLPNRVLFVDLLERAIKRTRRRPDYVFALLILGLDRFKSVADSLGLMSADRLLISVARRLQTCLRPTDMVARAEQSFTLARLAGDEFTILLDDIADASDAIRVAERLRAALETPFEVDGQQVYTSAGVGIAVSATGYEKADEILRDASIALHRAKADGSPRCEVFDVAMRQRAITRLQIETDLRFALEHRLFEVHYQPIVALQSGAIAGLESLVRWRHPSRGLVNPTEFISVAEDTGMILQIGRLMLAASCRQMVQWRRMFGTRAPRVVCVNVSSRQFADAHLARHIERILVETGLPASCLKLEITESAFLGDIQAARTTLGEVQSMGIEWSLDDFGTGYSSLSYLHRLQVETVKVDRSFVSRMGVEAGGAEMVRAIVALAHNLGMNVVAEGVETADQLAQVRALGCEFAQGFYFSRPVDADGAEQLISTQPWAVSQPALPTASAVGA
jgi:diguanylate cyclase (GGDEF)-like protein/PAS domain S-box-containing protein